MPFNRRMDKENVVHIHNGVKYTAKKSNDIVKFAGKWMDLENVILSKAEVCCSPHLNLNKISQFEVCVFSKSYLGEDKKVYLSTDWFLGR
ncbi:hypothetical protein STEG23_007916 [Scotinomys teguina]